MRFLLDTNIISKYLQLHPMVLERFKNTDRTDMCVSTITTMEVEYGFTLNPHSRERNTQVYEQLIAEIEILDFTPIDALITGKIRAELERQGVVIGNLDEMIAGIAVAQNLILITNNEKHFGHVQGLKLEDWSKS